jgi:tripeptidyl-peptidase-1
MPTQTLSSDLQTSQGVIEFQGESYNPTDLTGFGTGIDLTLEVLNAAHVIGPNAPSSPGVESTLDIEFIAGVNMEADNWFWLEDGNGWLYQFGVHFFSTPSTPQVVSISYGWWEGDQCDISQNCQSLGVDSTGYVKLVNTQFQKIGLRGLTLISASGDSGANGRTDGTCTIPQLRPAYPGSSPFITSVGATQLQNPVFDLPNAANIPYCQMGAQCPSGGVEVAVSYNVSGFASGGGFSNISSTPSYQQAAVKAYLSSGIALPPSSYYNAMGRGMPDLAAIGHNCMIDYQAQGQPVGGTSCASPIVAGVFALLNQEAIAVLGKPLGFLNPFIYKAFAHNPSNFNDVTIGDNICTEDGCSSTCTGFKCTTGWDPVTGLGSPNYRNLKNYISTLKAERDAKFPKAK